MPVNRHRASDYLTNFRSDVFWWEPDGRVVRMSPGDGIYMMSCVHPDGGHAVFWGGAEGRPRLWMADGGGGLQAVTEPTFSARYPAYNLAGDLLVYCRSLHTSETLERLRHGRTSAAPQPDATMSIVVRGTNGRERQLTDGTHLDQRPAVSPDGRRVAFVSNRGGAPGLWTVDTSGSGEPTPLLTGWPAYRPWWSVDGSHVFFFVLGSDRHRVHRVSARGGEPVPLANDDRGDTHGPYADPDGRHLLVHSTRGRSRPDMGLWGLYELPLDGSSPRRLSPPGFRRGAHGTRARNGVITFDVAWPGSRVRSSPAIRKHR